MTDIDAQEIGALRFIPVDREICDSLLSILNDQSVRVDKLNELICRDPVLLLEVVAAANGLKNVSGGKAVLEGKAALLALGLESIRKLVQELAETTPSYNGDKAFWLKVLKQKCRKSAAIASLVAKTVRPESVLESFTLGAFAYFGDLIALAKLGDRFISLLESDPRRSKLKYRLAKDFDFSMEEENTDYFRSRTLPNIIPLALDPDSSKLLPNIQGLKEICLSSIEFVDAFVEDRFDRLAPGVSIPPKSYRRMLALSDNQYEALYESLVTYLENGVVTGLSPEDSSADMFTSEGDVDAEGLAGDGIELAGIDSSEDSGDFGEAFLDSHVAGIVTDGDVIEFEDDYRPIETVPRRKYVSKSDRAMIKFLSMFEDTESVDELLQRLLDMLVAEPLFESAALLIVAPEEKKAMAIAVRGRTLVEGDSPIIEIVDPLSPLLHVKSKVASYSPKRRKHTPFGCGNYALAPLTVEYKRPVILYADCGDGNTLTFEARRLFRKVVNMLNNVLPEMEGGIPLEVDDTLSG